MNNYLLRKESRNILLVTIQAHADAIYFDLGDVRFTSLNSMRICGSCMREGSDLGFKVEV